MIGRRSRSPIGPTQIAARLGREFMNVNMLVDLDDVSGTHLSHEPFGDGGDELLMEVMPGIILLQVRIHPRERRGHGNDSTTRGAAKQDCCDIRTGAL
jgi:hypothetical protein